MNAASVPSRGCVTVPENGTNRKIVQARSADGQVVFGPILARMPMLTTAAFREIVDRKISKAREQQAVPSTSEEVRLALCACFASGLPVISTALYRLKTQLHYELEVLGIGDPRHLSVAHALCDHFGGHTSGHMEAGDCWDTAVSVLLQHRTLDRMLREGQRLHPSQRRVLDAVIRLRRLGFEVTMIDGDPSMEDSVWKKMCAYVDTRFAALDGVAAVEAHFARQVERWHPPSGRFHLGQRYTPIGEARLPFPHGMWLHFCYRATLPRESDASPCSVQDLRTIVEDLAALFEAAWTTYFEGMFVGPEHLQTFVGQCLLYDTLYSAEQVPPKHALAMIVDIWGGPELAQLVESDAMRRILMALAAAACTALGDGVSPGRVRRKRLLRSLPTSDRVSGEALLADLLVCSDVRGMSVDPLDAGARRYPFFEVEPGHLWHPPPSLTCARLLEVVHQGLVGTDGQWSKAEGYALERHLRDALSAHGVDSLHGKYVTSARQQGEIDLAVVDPEAIILFEVKRRQLTRPAKHGGVAEALRDLTVPLVEAHNQVLEHELRLREDKELRLRNARGELVRLRWEGQPIERVMVSMFDFGSLQARESTRAFLRAACGLRFSTEHKGLKPRMKELSEALDELANLLLQLQSHKDAQSNLDFMNVQFVSIPYLHMMLDTSAGKQDFVKNLRLGKHLSSSTRNPYDEFAHVYSLPRK